MKRTPLRKQSLKRARENRLYAKLRTEFLLAKVFCEFPDCFSRATDVHHINGRAGKWLNDQRYWTGLCRKHHQFIHDHPATARGMGLLK